MGRLTSVRWCAVLLVILCLSFSGQVLAKDFYLDPYKVEAQVTSDGDLVVTEHVTYQVSGHFNGVYQNVSAQGYGRFENIALTDSDGRTYQASKSGQPWTYQLTTDRTGVHYKVFSPMDDTTRTFTYRYRCHDVITRYPTQGELYWQFLSGDGNVRTNNITVTVTLPPGAAKNQIQAWGHGALSGSVQILNGQAVRLTLATLPSNTFLEARILFPSSLIPKAVRTGTAAQLLDIKKQEKQWAENANNTREQARGRLGMVSPGAQQQIELQKQKLGSTGMAYSIGLGFLFFVSLLLLFRLYVTYDREFQPEFSGDYYRELPGTYTPAEMDVLWSFGGVSARDLTATLLDLVRKRHLLLQINQEQKRVALFWKKEVPVTSLVRSTSEVPLKEHETYLLDWFLNEIGDGQQVTLEDIEQYSKSKRQAQLFKIRYDNWVSLVKQAAAENGFFDKTLSKGRWMAVLSGLALLAVGVLSFISLVSIIGVIRDWGGNAADLSAATAPIICALLCGIMGVVLIIFAARLSRRTQYGSTQHAQWAAFRRFLLHFSQLDRAEWPAVTMWEHYLVYAVPLGVAKEVIKKLKVSLVEQDFNDRNLTYLYAGAYGMRWTEVLDHMDGFAQAVQATSESAISVANSANSSSSGGGGGFSGGGGGGGGGSSSGAF